jgi:hypothetical protein
MWGLVDENAIEMALLATGMVPMISTLSLVTGVAGSGWERARAGTADATTAAAARRALARRESMEGDFDADRP